ncbi:hypothetical protein CVT26_015158 [Gymnopilus dilepis]|uniref:C2H2-type domain-containing protein n=1 Tax=Gymnopilus dilepis TaxID=231916 RepID=A0A409WA11_9AGAR|nr:hypothetical protein CVT26_015158 [Gymnopilus dilepis]
MYRLTQLSVATVVVALRSHQIFVSLFFTTTRPQLNTSVFIMSVPCEAGCPRRFNTIASMHKHLVSSKKCAGYLQGKLRDIGLFDDDLAALDRDTDTEEDDEDVEASYEPFIFEPPDAYINELHFTPRDDVDDRNANDGSNSNAIAGPGPATAANILRRGAAAIHRERVFDDRTDQRTVDWVEGAGRVLRKVTPPSYIDGDARDEEGDVQMADGGSSPFVPFSSELDWKVAQWAIRDGPGQGAFDRLLEIPGVVEKLGLSYHNIRALHQKIDSIPERAGVWETKHLFFNDDPNEKYTIRFRDPIEAIKSLWKDPELSPHMFFRPAKVYTNKDREIRIFSEMHTSKWWHVCQSKLPNGATLAPVIIATDKTQLTQFSGSKSAYPIYLTIGNIPKAMRRKPSKKACILIGYLSVEKVARNNMTARAARSRIQRIFHESMRIILEPLKKAGHNGVEMTGADGAVRLVFPILSCYVADYPEQCLVTCSKYGSCVKCKAETTELGDHEAKEARSQPWTESILTEAHSLGGQDSRAFYDHCMSHGVAGGTPKPFCYTKGYSSILLAGASEF